MNRVLFHSFLAGALLMGMIQSAITDLWGFFILAFFLLVLNCLLGYANYVMFMERMKKK